MTVQEICYLCQKRPLVPRERGFATFMECPNCDNPNGTVSPSRPEDSPLYGANR